MQRAAKAMLFGGVGPWAACLGEVTSLSRARAIIIPIHHMQETPKNAPIIAPARGDHQSSTGHMQAPGSRFSSRAQPKWMWAGESEMCVCVHRIEPKKGL